MSTRITPTSSLPEPRKPAKTGGVPEREAVGREPSALAPPTPLARPTLPPASWANAAGVELYRRVQDLPNQEPRGEAEKTPRDPEHAKRVGVGRSIDTYA